MMMIVLILVGIKVIFVTSRYDNLLWNGIKDEDYNDIIEDLEHNMIKLDDGTTIFNVYFIGQAVAHDMLIDECWDEDNLTINESDILAYISDHFYDVMYECMQEAKRKLKENNKDLDFY